MTRDHQVFALRNIAVALMTRDQQVHPFLQGMLPFALWPSATKAPLPHPFLSYFFGHGLCLLGWLCLAFCYCLFCLFHSKFPHPSTQPYCKVFLSLLQGFLSLVARVCVALLARVFCPLSHGLSLKLILDQWMLLEKELFFQN